MRLNITSCFNYRPNIGMIRSILTILLIFLVFGCASIPSASDRASYLSKNIPPGPEKTIIYFYPSMLFDYMTYNVSLGGFSGKVDWTTYIVWETKPGVHTLRIQNPLNDNLLFMHKTFSTTGGQNLFFTNERPRSILNLGGLLPHVGVYQVSTEKGIDVINMRALAKWHKTIDLPPASSQVNEDSENIYEIPDFRSAPRDNDVAVVIGIEKYQNVPKSDFSKNDAGIVKDYLKALGFRERNIEFITDEKATKSSIEKSIEAWIPNRIKSESSVFIYYSGHGAPDPQTGEAYLVPYDGDPNYLSVTGYPLKRLYDKLGRFNAGEIIVVLDSCFSGSGSRSVLAKGARPLVMLAENSTLSQNIVVLTSTQVGQISSSSPDRKQGIFTFYFLKAIKDGKKNIAEIYEYIKPLVEDEAKAINTQQTPSLNPGIEKIKGRFNLRK